MKSFYYNLVMHLIESSKVNDLLYGLCVTLGPCKDMGLHVKSMVKGIDNAHRIGHDLCSW